MGESQLILFIFEEAFISKHFTTIAFFLLAIFYKCKRRGKLLLLQRSRSDIEDPRSVGDKFQRLGSKNERHGALTKEAQYLNYNFHFASNCNLFSLRSACSIFYTETSGHASSFPILVALHYLVIHHLLFLGSEIVRFLTRVMLAKMMKKVV